VVAKRGFFIMQSYDGLKSIDASQARPADIILSGPSAGVVAARLIGERSGYNDLISLDIGGTSTDVALIENGALRYSTERAIENIPIPVPMVDIHTIGAGGGSKIWVDVAGGLHVGPQSAGSVPGPACYGSSLEPTVTDADVFLGYLNPQSLLDGAKPIFIDQARKAIELTVCDRLGLDSITAARGAVRIFINAVQGAIRVVSIAEGRDPRQFTLVAFGGGGPTHSCEIAEELGIRRVVIPPFPGLAAALGLLAADVSHNQVRVIEAPLADLSAEAIRSDFRGIEAKAVQELSLDGIEAEGIVRVAELRFRGQTYSIAVSVDEEMLAAADLPNRLAAEFSRQHESVYGFSHATEKIDLFCLRIRGSGNIAGGWPSLLTQQGPADADSTSAQRRTVHFASGASIEVPVYRRAALGFDATIHGPAIIEQYDTTTVVPPGWAARQEASGNLVLEAEAKP
jgi:N-methylhydantoinase A